MSGISATEITPESNYYKPQFLTLSREFLPFPSNLLPTNQPHPLHPSYIDTPLPALLTEAFRKLRHTSDTGFPNSPGMGRTEAPQMQHEQMQQKKKKKVASKLCRVATAIQINHPQAKRPHLAQVPCTASP